jgi:WD40 repeat protein
MEVNAGNIQSNIIISSKTPTEEDKTFESQNINYFPYAQNKYEMKFLNVYYPTFKYDRFKLSHLEVENPPYGECFSCNFDENGNYLAAGFSNGYVNIFNLIPNAQKKFVDFQIGDYPITSLKFNKHVKSTLLVGSADGSVSHYHSVTGKLLHKIQEEGNAINSVDYSNDGKRFCTGGNDISVRLYDEGMKTMICKMEPYKFNEPGHSGRIFTVKFNPENSNTIFSGGWDKTIQFYDCREGKIVSSIYGPHICGDALDIQGFTLLTGAWSKDKQIQLWDIRSLKCMLDIKWENGNTYYPTYIYSCKFNTRKDLKLFSVGGVNKNMFRIFDIDKFNFTNKKKKKKDDSDDEEEVVVKPVALESNEPVPIFGDKEMKVSCFCTDWVKISQRKEYFATGCNDGGIRIYSIESKN